MSSATGAQIETPAILSIAGGEELIKRGGKAG
jgi:hypothetical protein